jgi:hypothetical protein
LPWFEQQTVFRWLEPRDRPDKTRGLDAGKGEDYGKKKKGHSRDGPDDDLGM